ncbi:hypothetical protein OIU78_023107 [Salix suchowensis]|nr:hypothetical protein OIU78_023107 [Salix suchowensis]
MDSCEEMNRVLFKAAGAGNVDPFENYQTSLDRLLTPDENTILHVYLRNQWREPRSTDFVDKILERCPALLLQANKKGETPLHVAAKFGHSNVVKVLIDRAKAPHADPESGVTAAKMMLRMTNGEGDTALHEAARNAQGHVVEILTKEDPDFSYSANVHGETPLYIAASVGQRREHGKVIDEILRNCISVDYGGPHGKTALHAAITAGNNVIAKQILEKEKELTKRTDDNGWSPLHYAAYFSRWPDFSVVVALLECDASAAYMAETTEKKRTALHIAAIQGHACLWMPELKRLKTEKDDKGNTPFHLIAALTHKEYRWDEVYPNSDEESGKYGLNKQDLSIANIYRGDFGEIQEEIIKSLEDVGNGPFGYGPFNLRREKAQNREEAFNKARESYLVVAALIATVTFAAAFTLPGGYKSNQGTAILAKNAAFIVFLISDAISMKSINLSRGKLSEIRPNPAETYQILLQSFVSSSSTTSRPSTDSISRHPRNDFEPSLDIDGEPTSNVSTINRPGVLQTTSSSLVSSKPARDILHADEEPTVAASTKIQLQSMINEAKPDFEAKLERLKKLSEMEAESNVAVEIAYIVNSLNVNVLCLCQLQVLNQ